MLYSFIYFTNTKVRISYVDIFCGGGSETFLIKLNYIKNVFHINYIKSVWLFKY